MRWGDIIRRALHMHTAYLFFLRLIQIKRRKYIYSRRKGGCKRRWSPRMVPRMREREERTNVCVCVRDLDRTEGGGGYVVVEGGRWSGMGEMMKEKIELINLNNQMYAGTLVFRILIWRAFWASALHRRATPCFYLSSLQVEGNKLAS